MPISTECGGCGAKFQAPDKLAGRRVKCPKCGQPIQVGDPGANATIAVACDCGKRFRAKAAMAGKRVKCPGCGNPLTIPGGEPAPTQPAVSTDNELDSLLAAEMPPALAEGTPLSPVLPRKRKANNRLVIGLIAGAGAIVVAIVLAIVLWPADDDTSSVASNPPPGGNIPAPVAPGPTAPDVPTAPGDPPAPTTPATSNGPAFPDAVTEAPKWLLADAPFDVVKFFAAPPPEENAAPLYLDALYEFGSDVDICFPEEERARRSPIVKQREKRFGELYSSWQDDPESVDGAAVDAMLAEFNVGFQKLSRAQQRQRCVFQTGIHRMALLPHPQNARQVTRVVQLRTAGDLDRGDIERPLQGLETVLRLSRDIRPRGVLVCQLVSCSLAGIAYRDIIPEVLAARGITTEHCQRLLAMLEQHEQGVNMALEGCRAEYVELRSFMYDLEHHTGIFNPQTPLAPQALDYLRWFDNVRSRLKALGKMEEWLATIDYPQERKVLDRWYGIVTGSPETKFQGRKEAVEPLVEEATQKKMLMGLILPATGAFHTAIARHQVFHRGTKCLVALRRWQLENDGPPPDLATVVKAAGMEQVPIDPYSDQPMRMTTIDGQPVIYSVGPDRKDDQGLIDWGLNGYLSPGDILFRLP